MLRAVARTLPVLLAACGGLLTALYVTNATPAVPRLSEADLDGRPILVKMHAQWCPVCRLTKDVWTELAAEYAGRVHLVVFDFTTEETTRLSRAEARRLSLGAVFDEYEGATGYVVVVDGRSKTPLQEIKGSRDLTAYRRMIDAAIDASREPATAALFTDPAVSP